MTRSEAVILNTGRRDNSVRLTCEVSGSPSPVLAWYRGEALVQTSARHVVTREDVGGHVSRHVLSLLAVADVDYGNYSCLATNTVGSDRSGYKFLQIRSSSRSYKILGLSHPRLFITFQWIHIQVNVNIDLEILSKLSLPRIKLDYLQLWNRYF